MAYRFKQPSIIPGFGLSLGYTLLYLGLIVLMPLAAVFTSAMSMSWSEFVEAATSARVMASYKLSFGASFLAAVVNVFAGLLVAWVLVRYRFPGRRL
ncbi:MAG TPA: hypothetical protein VLH60_05370, partial [Sedimentisphaerales bacterium]|nr:hypothetical protein [Sedimentisphaerales bacterium]